MRRLWLFLAIIGRPGPWSLPGEIVYRFRPGLAWEIAGGLTRANRRERP